MPAATFSSPAAERYRKHLLILCCTRKCTEHTCVNFLCLSGNKMAAIASTKPARPAPTSLKLYGSILSSMKTYTVCKGSGTQLKFFGNTTNLRNHLSWERSSDLLQVPARWRSNSERAKRITKSISSFIALDLRLYSSVENVGFRTMVFTLEPRYKMRNKTSLYNFVLNYLLNENHYRDHKLGFLYVYNL